LLTLSLFLPCGSFYAAAQEMHEAAPAKLSEHLEIRGLNGATLTLTPADLKALPHKTVTVVNAHNNKSETYSGVVLADLLSKLNVPLGEDLRGKLFLTGVVAEGTDGYKVLYSLAEVDPRMHTGDVIVADTVNGEPIGRNGAFQLINTEDKRPARWVHNLERIEVAPVVTM
jgi:DMSO/TMAO reductase YedYZ molybdopterin-dependent catalytic subunit